MIHYDGKSVALSPDIPFNARDQRNLPEVFKWCRQYTLIDQESHNKWLANISKDPTIKMFGIVCGKALKSQNVGVCGLTSIDHVNQKAEFSLYIFPKYHSSGYGKDALYTLLKHGFNDLNLNRIWGEVYDGNPAMILFESLGFKKEGIQRQSYFRQGRFINSHIISILRDEWIS